MAETCEYVNDEGAVKVSLDNERVAARMALAGFHKQGKKRSNKSASKSDDE